MRVEGRGGGRPVEDEDVVHAPPAPPGPANRFPNAATAEASSSRSPRIAGLRRPGRPPRRRDHARAADVVEHLAHAVDVCGEDHVGIGTDGPVTAIDDLDAYRERLAEHVARRRAAGVSAAGERADTYPFVVDLRGVDQFRELIRLLERRGWSATRIEKIMGRNFLDYAERVWTA
ncbi:membrane dipeptidase [Streptomyces antibioticus]|uniref:membrane dipeptidase n=1 Tax=Streptomyces antibioticus TaxID=1890 RepID=UPI00371DB343